MRKVTVFTLITCLFVLFPLTLNSQPPPPPKKVPVQKPDFVLAFPGKDAINSISEMIFTPAGQLLTVYKEDPITCRFWDLSNGEAVRAFKLAGSAESEVNPYARVLFSNADKLLLAVPEMSRTPKYIRLWNVLTGTHIRDLTSDRYHFRQPVFSPDGKFLFCSHDKGLGLKEVEGPNSWDLFYNRSPNREFLDRGVTFSPDGKFLVYAVLILDMEGSNWKKRTLEIQAWDPHTGKEIRTVVPSLNGFDHISIKDLIFRPDRRNFAVALQRGNRVKFRDPTEIPENSKVTTIELWDLSGKLLRSLEFPIGQHTNSIVFSPDGRMIAAPITDKMSRRKNTVQLWDIDTGKLIRTLSSPSGDIESVVFSPDGQRIVGTSISSDQVPVWDPLTGKLIALLDNGVNGALGFGITNIMFRPDGRFVAGTLGAGPFGPGAIPMVWKITSDRD